MSAPLSRRGFLSVGEREYLLRKIREKEHSLAGKIVVPENKKAAGEGMDPRRLGRLEQHLNPEFSEDKGLMRRQINRLNDVLRKGSADGLSKRDKTKAERQVAEDKEWLRGRMCPRTLFQKKYSDPEFEKAKNACMKEHDPEFQKRASRFKSNMRMIDPDNRNASNLENIRPD